MQSNDFYVTLLSNNNLDLYPLNEQSCFINSFPSLHLNTDFMVGLTEIIIPHSFYNINDSNNQFIVQTFSLVNTAAKPKRLSIENEKPMHDEPEPFDPVDSMVERISQKIQSMTKVKQDIQTLRQNKIINAFQLVEYINEHMHDFINDSAFLKEIDQVFADKLTTGEIQILEKAKKQYLANKDLLLPIWNGVKEEYLFNLVLNEKVENDNMKMERKITNLDRKIKSNNDAITKIKNDIRHLLSLHAKVTAIEQNITDIKNTISAKDTTANELASLNTKINALDQAIIEIKNTISAINITANELTSLNTKIDTIDHTITDIKNRINVINISANELASLNAKINIMEQTVTDIKSTISAENITVTELAFLNTKINTIEHTITDIKTTMNTINVTANELVSLNAKITIIEQNITSIQNKINTNEASVNEIKQLRDTLEKYNSILTSVRQAQNNHSTKYDSQFQTIQTKIKEIEASIVSISTRPTASPKQTPFVSDSLILENNSLITDENLNVESVSTSSNISAPENVYVIRIPSGFYTDIPSLLNSMMKEIKNTLPTLHELIIFDYKPHSRRVSITLPNNYAITWTNEEHKSFLGAMLGFQQNVISKSCIATYEPDLLAGKDLLFIYCSILEPQIVGNTKTHLLTIVPVNVKRNEYIVVRYDTPRYLRLSHSIMNNIKIEIRDSTGELIKFEAGTVMLRLHFK